MTDAYGRIVKLMRSQAQTAVPERTAPAKVIDEAGTIIHSGIRLLPADYINMSGMSLKKGDKVMLRDIRIEDPKNKVGYAVIGCAPEKPGIPRTGIATGTVTDTVGTISAGGVTLSSGQYRSAAGSLIGKEHKGQTVLICDLNQGGAVDYMVIGVI
jgi:hypothetical protein